jgi:hypothetical protein
MRDRGTRIGDMACEQVSELIEVLSVHSREEMSLPCPGRETMGDGSVAACAAHTAERYELIAEFVRASSQERGAHPRSTRGRHLIPGLLGARGHTPGSHAERGHDEGSHDGDYTAENVDLDELLERLRAARDGFDQLAERTDEQLDTVPPAGSFRFCDGQRSLEQVLTSLFKHQGHQVDAIKAALTRAA